MTTHVQSISSDVFEEIIFEERTSLIVPNNNYSIGDIISFEVPAYFKEVKPTYITERIISVIDHNINGLLSGFVLIHFIPIDQKLAVAEGIEHAAELAAMDCGLTDCPVIVLERVTHYATRIRDRVEENGKDV